VIPGTWTCDQCTQVLYLVADPTISNHLKQGHKIGCRRQVEGDDKGAYTRTFLVFAGMSLWVGLLMWVHA
jgi:hypothetical protein